jgi:hypothetical protein
MPAKTRRLILITGIPGTGKSTYGKKLSKRFGFVHLDLENSATLARLLSDPGKFIEDILKEKGNVIATWGFAPCPEQIRIVGEFKKAGFKLVWFDGNRPAALREFIKRRTVPEEPFYRQMWGIESSKVIQQIDPLLVNTFDRKGRFKKPATVLRAIEKA